MRLLSPNARYSIQVFEAREQIVMDARGYGETRVLEKAVVANFAQGGLLDWEVEAALEKFNFSGLPEGVNPLTRIGVFDTEAYAESNFPKDNRSELLAQMDERLRELAERNPSQFIIVEPPEAAKPWPTYDEDSVEDILKFQERLGFSPIRIRKYEEEHAVRPEILSVMWALEGDDSKAAQFAGEAQQAEQNKKLDGTKLASNAIGKDEVPEKVEVTA